MLAVTPILWARASRTPRAQEIQDSLESWTRENYGRALDLVFQGACATSKEARWFSCVRSLPGHKDEIEYSFFLEKRYDGTVFARIARPKAQSIYRQLRQRKEENPRGSVGDLAKLIQIESQVGDQRRFGRLAELATDFEELQVSPIPADEIIMDATEYRFRISSSSGEMNIVLRGPGSGAPHQSQPLIQWAESLRDTLASAFH
jgi:hypothetical protein